MVPVFYHKDIEIAKNVVKACYAGGVRAFEFTSSGEFAHEVFGKLNKFAAKECPEMILGVGSIVNAPAASLYIQLGANFVVGPLFNPDVARVCNRRLIPWSLLMVTGGVKPEEANLKAWFDAGVSCVGMGSNLFPKDVIEAEDWDKISALCKNALDIIKNVRIFK